MQPTPASATSAPGLTDVAAAQAGHGRNVLPEANGSGLRCRGWVHGRIPGEALMQSDLSHPRIAPDANQAGA
jgi:hypothetical protein